MGKRRTYGRRLFTCLLALLLAAGLVPTLPQAPRALAEEEATDALVLGDEDVTGPDNSVVGESATDVDVHGSASDATGEGASGGDVAELGEPAPGNAVELGDTGSTETDDESAAVVLDEATEDALIDQLELVARDDLAAGDDAATVEGPDLRAQSVSVSNPRVRADSSMESGQVATWDCLWFGSYPQTEVAPTDAAYASMQSASWDANGDATVGGRRYRRISKSDATYDGYWSGDGYGSATWRYFRYEPIKWRVLKVNGSKALVVSDVALDDQMYNANWEDVTWETSSVRSWLNGYEASSNEPDTDFTRKNFLSTALSPSERSAILPAFVTKENYSYYDYTNIKELHGTVHHGGVNNVTVDYVFLLSVAEVCNGSYGFFSYVAPHDEARCCKVSDYARASGVYRTTSSGCEGNCWWWLRYPAEYGAVSWVAHDGSVQPTNTYVNDNRFAVRPALYLNLASPYLQTAGTVSSNGVVDEWASIGTGGNSTEDIASNVITVSFNECTYEWTGKPVEPPALITYGDKVLAPGRDYTVSYADNVKPGIATATFTGIGAYSRSVSKKFMIVYAPKKRKGRDCSYIVGRVREYTSGNMRSQFDLIGGVGDKSEVQFRQLHEFFVGKGFLNARDGIAYLRDTVRQRRAYDALICDDVFIAHQYYWWLNYEPMGIATRALLFADDYIFNAKYSGYTDLPALAKGETPNIKKCKNLLQDFMKDMGHEVIKSDLAEFIKNAGEITDKVSEASGKVTDGGKEYAEELIRRLDSSMTDEEFQAVLNKCNEMGVFKTLEQKKSVFTYRLSEDSGFGKFSKAMKQGNAVVGCIVNTFGDVKDLVTLDAHLKCYMSYIEFLDEVAHAPDLPLQMRWAAGQIRAEMDLGPWAKIRDIAINILSASLDVGYEKSMASITSDALKSSCKKVLGEGKATTIAGYVVTAQVSAWFINEFFDVGSLAKGSDLVEGYEKLCAHYKEKLMDSWDDFTAKETEDNAWRFFENYNMLWQLRVKAEKAYFKMMDIGKLTKLFVQGGTQLKREAVNESLKRLGEMAFVLEDTDDMPNSAQFAKYSKDVKFVVDCPVDVDVYDPSGKLVCTMADGRESEVTNSHGTFVVTYRPWTGEWAKAAFVNSGGYRLVARAKDAGTVSVKMMTGADKQNVWSTDNVAVKKGSKVEFAANVGATAATTRVDANGDGRYESKQEARKVDADQVKANGVELSAKSIKLVAGESASLGVTVSPANASCQDVRWVSTNEKVATVLGGKVVGVGKGSASVLCVSEDNSDAMATCKVSVLPKVVKGKTYSKSGMRYKVTRVAKKGKAGTVTLAKAKNAKKVTVPASVKLADGRSYNVVAVGKGAFKSLSQVTTVDVGKKVAIIGAGAFNNLPKLASVSFGAGVKKVGSGAFVKTPRLATVTVKGKLLNKKASVKGMLKGSKVRKTVTVKVPKAMYKTYKKVFTKGNVFGEARGTLSCDGI